MKQLLSLFLFLLPCLAWAQYPSNGNQKITLGEQTSADGLIYRGVAATDTVRKPSIDTMAYMVLDTTTNIIWHYKKATSNSWLRLNLLPSDTASMLTNYYRSGRTGIIQASDVPTLNQNTTGSAATLTTSRTFQTNLASTSTASFNGSANVTPGVTGTLPVANGGTNATTLTANKVMVGNGTSGVLTPTNLHWDNTNNRLGIGTSSPSAPFTINSDAAGGVSGNVTNSVYPMRLINSPTAGQGSYNVFDLRMARGGVENRNPSFSFSTDNTDGDFYNLCQIGAIADLASGNNIAGNLIFTVKPSGSTITERMRINSNGELTIGYDATDNGAYKLQVNSQIFATNATIATSDIRFKENIQLLDKGLEIINKLKPVKFNFITTTENNFSEFDEIGFIAQDVEGALSTELFAKAVVKKLDEDKDDSALGLMTEKLIPILVKAIQEQQALIKALEQRIINLENK